MVAQRQVGRYPHEVVQTALRVMAMDPADGMAPYVAGMTWLTALQSPRDALPFLAEAVRRQPGKPRFATALASAWEKAGFPDQAVAILKQRAPEVRDDPYPLYLLGKLLAAREEFPAAVRTLRSALPMDTEGYAHDAYLRTRYAAGELVGLASKIESALRRFPRILNRSALERILFGLQPREYAFADEVRVQISNPAEVRALHVLMRFPPDVPHHQEVEVASAEFEISGRRFPATWKGPEADGRHRFSCAADTPGPMVVLRVWYRIRITPWLGQRGPFPFRMTGGAPDLERLKADRRFSLDDPRLEHLMQRLAREPGNFLQNAYRAVGRGLAYRENFEDRSVAWALDHLDQSDCTEFARLLVALCLKRAIPARLVTGFLVKEEFLRETPAAGGQEITVGHAWSEVFFPDRGWVPVDPTLGATHDWAHFGNLLSDQIVFDHEEEGRTARIGVDFVATAKDVQVQITNAYRVRLIR